MARTPEVAGLVLQRALTHPHLVSEPARPELARAMLPLLGAPAVQRLVASWARLTVQRQTEQSQWGGTYESEEARGRAAEIEQREAQALDPPARSSDLKYYITVLPPALKVAQGEGVPLENTLMMLAQAQVEHSKTIPAGNMIFGITTKSTDPSQHVTTTTSEVKGGRLVKEKSRKFRKYASAEDSVKGYLNLLGGQDPEHDLYKKNKGQPLSILKESGQQGGSDRVARFRQSVVGGGYSTNPNGFCTNVGSEEAPQFQYSKGYNQVYPVVYNQVLEELRGKADMVSKVVSELQLENDLITEVAEGYEHLALALEADITETSEETEKIRRDATLMRKKATDLRERVTKTRETITQLDEFKNRIKGVKTETAPPDFKCTAKGQVVP